MALTFISAPISNNDEDFKSDITLSVTVEVGDGIAVAVGSRHIEGSAWSAPVLESGIEANWQTFETIGTPVNSSTEIDVFYWKLQTTIAGTFNIRIINTTEAPIVNSAAVVLRPENPLSVLTFGNDVDFFPTFVTQKYMGGAFTAPEITLPVGSNGLIVQFFNPILWDDEYSITTTTWTANAPSTLRASVLNTGNSGVGRMYSVTAGANDDDVIMGFTRSNAEEPMFVFSAFTVTEPSGILRTIDTITIPLRVGDTANITTTNMGDLTISSTLSGMAIQDADAPDGDGTITLPPFLNGSSYIAMGDVEVVVRDADNSSEPYETTITTMDGWQYVDVVDMDTGPWSLGQAVNAGTVVTQVHVIDDGIGVLNPNLTLTNWALGTYTAWMRDGGGIMRAITFTVTESGVTTGGFDFIQPIEFVGFIQ